MSPHTYVVNSAYSCHQRAQLILEVIKLNQNWSQPLKCCTAINTPPKTKQRESLKVIESAIKLEFEKVRR